MYTCQLKEQYIYSQFLCYFGYYAIKGRYLNNWCFIKSSFLDYESKTNQIFGAKMCEQLLELLLCYLKQDISFH